MAQRRSSSRPAGGSTEEELRVRLNEAEETIRAIRSGEVDAVVVAGKLGDQVFTLTGAEQAYRMLIESMNEGALMLMADGVILYTNQSFARMVKCPLEQVTGGSFRRFLSTKDRAALRPLLKQADKLGAKIQVLLNAADGSHLPVQISLRPQATSDASRSTFCIVVTDMTESRRIEELLRALTHRVVQVQEAERGRVALELHDNITQLLCAALFRSQALAQKLSASEGAAKSEANQLREMLGNVAQEVERISHNLRPSILDQLGLTAILHDTSTEFTNRTGVAVKLDCMELSARLPADTELTIYRIFQEALGNIERHARASHVTVCLNQQVGFMVFLIQDDGIGFDPEHQPARRNRKGGLGLLSMSERASYVGGFLTVKSVRCVGTKIEVRIPLTVAA